MAVSVRGRSGDSESALESTASVPAVAGTTTGDVVLLWACQWNPTSDAPIPQAPAGFTRVTTAKTVFENEEAQTIQLTAWWRRASGPESGSYSITNVGEWNNAGVVVWSGVVSTGNPVRSYAASQIAGNTRYPTLSVSSQPGDALTWFGGSDDDPTHDPPDGYDSVPLLFGMVGTTIATGTTSTASGATAASGLDLADILVCLAAEADEEDPGPGGPAPLMFDGSEWVALEHARVRASGSWSGSAGFEMLS